MRKFCTDFTSLSRVGMRLQNSDANAYQFQEKSCIKNLINDNHFFPEFCEQTIDFRSPLCILGELNYPSRDVTALRFNLLSCACTFFPSLLFHNHELSPIICQSQKSSEIPWFRYSIFRPTSNEPICRLHETSSKSNEFDVPAIFQQLYNDSAKMLTLTRTDASTMEVSQLRSIARRDFY